MKTAFHILALGLFWGGALHAEERDLVLEWKPVAGATKYEVRLVDGEGKEYKFQVAEKTRKFRKKLAPGFYQYTLRTWDRFDRPSRWTEPEDIRIQPAPPVVIAPSTDQMVNLGPENPAALLKWNPSKGAQTYEVQWRALNEEEITEPSDVAERQIEPQKPGKYQWRVRALISKFSKGPRDPIVSSWSGWKPFSVAFPNVATPLIQSPRIKPINFDKSIVRLNWQSAEGAKAYEVKLTPKGRAPASTETRITRGTAIDFEVLASGEYDVAVRGLASETPSERFGSGTSTAVVSFLYKIDWADRDEYGLSSSLRLYQYQNVNAASALTAATSGSAVALEAFWRKSFKDRWSSLVRFANTAYRIENKNVFAQMLIADFGRRTPISTGRWWLITRAGAYLNRSPEVLADLNQGSATDPFIGAVATAGPFAEIGVERRFGKRWRADIGAQAGVPLLLMGAASGSSLSMGLSHLKVLSTLAYWAAEEWAVSFGLGWQQSSVSFRRQSATASDSIVDSGMTAQVGFSYVLP